MSVIFVFSTYQGFNPVPLLPIGLASFRILDWQPFLLHSR